MLGSWLFAWFRKTRASRLHVRMYTRRGCHLCAVAWALLSAERRHHGFALEAVDVDSDPALAEQYGKEVPVVVVNGQVRFRGVVNRVLLRRLLRAQGRKI